MIVELPTAIRPLSETDLLLVARHLNFDWGQPDKHRERFNRQQKGVVTCLIAWNEKLPAGHVLIEWAGSTDEPMASVLETCPDFQDLWVLPDFRSKGIGSKLLDAAENLAGQREYAQVGLGVSIDNRRARSLFARRGYKDAGLGHYVTGGHYLDRQGKQQPWSEICDYLIRPLWNFRSARITRLKVPKPVQPLQPLQK